MQKLRQLGLLMIFWLITASSTSATQYNLPDLGSPGLVLYDKSMESELGRAFMTALHTDFTMIDDPFVVEYVRQIGSRLTSHLADGRQYHFFIIDRPEINAFAGPDGIIGINRGLILAATSEDALASVIAHEIAHITQEHLSRRFEQFEQGNITSFASLLAAILIGTLDPSAGIATFIGGNSLAIQNQLRFSRIHEHEADSVGIKLLAQAGYNPRAMAQFFDQLHQQHNHSSRPPEVLLTHPVTERRTALALARAEQQKTTQERYLDLKLIQARLTDQRIPLEQLNEKEHEAFHCYKNYLNLTNTPDNAAEIKSCLIQATKNQPGNRLLEIALADIKDRSSNSVSNLLQLKDLYPQDNALAHQIAHQYQHRNDIGSAIAILKHQATITPTKIELYQQISELYLQKNDIANALYFQALRANEIGNIRQFKHLLKEARKHASETPTLLKKINNLLQENN
ncbi:M48 family metalloprotease [Thiomicrospira sp. ALE5]|uniref:M48 family metalloprotease n=1 Tax=Thiomicrospira sp. ALE5 TaxID=748650 RepID=UPI0008EC7596|nr:M48 family metalloprotease [Thiomicrospira sp. ALE5]SFR63061.1 Putative Zn-dependent protease, contains TPR repeats [Thiomicrospira sp. ALE5]